jgi:kynureninase
MGAETPFEFDLDYTPAPGLDRFLVGTPPILSLLSVEPALDILLEAGISRLRKKSVAQSSYLIELARAWLLPLGFEIGTPLDPELRGSHVSLRHPEAYRISQAMIASDLSLRPEDDETGSIVYVIPDFRTPDNIRLGLVPLYNTYAEIHRALTRIRVIVETQEFAQFSHQRPVVT